MNTQKDLFQHIETLPELVQELIESFSLMENDYRECEALKQALNKLGYTCEYGLDAVPFNLSELQEVNKAI